MIDLKIVIAIIFIHWIADFVCQKDWQAKNKSKSNFALLTHTTVYSLAWLPFCLLYGVNNDYNKEILLFVPITFICHTITDYFISRLNYKLWAEGKVHYCFVSAGFEQVLYYVQLLLTYQILK